MNEFKMKPYEELDITDNFMFCKVFSNVDVAKDFLQAILKVNIEKISVVSEATTQEDPFPKGVRFDTPPQACSLLPEHVRFGRFGQGSRLRGTPGTVHFVHLPRRYFP